MRLNPFHPEWYWVDLAIALYAARRYEDALEAGRRIVALGRPRDTALLAACYAQLGQLDEARKQTAEVLRRDAHFHLSDQRMPFKNPTDADHVFEGMRKAGLPE